MIGHELVVRYLLGIIAKDACIGGVIARIGVVVKCDLAPIGSVEELEFNSAHSVMGERVLLVDRERSGVHVCVAERDGLI